MQIPYFMNPADNVQIIRYIIGDIERLFCIGPQQQENLMNVSIMYEPSQSAKPKNIHSLQPIHENKKEMTEKNVWDRPKGEWESLYLLKASQMFYNTFIRNSQFNDFYCKHIAKYHRTFLINKKVIGWTSVLILSYLYCHWFLFAVLFSFFCLLQIVAMAHLG